MKIPVLLITFNRPDHTKRTIDALRTQQPPLVYVYQDGPRDGNELDKTKCELVKQVINTSIDWPCELHFDVSVNNRGCRDSVIYAITEVLKCHDCVIVVEDDIVTSPAFYSFMCLALDYYKDRKAVFSVSGHSHSPSKFKVPNDYPYDVFASPRLFNWGWGTWKDRWEQTDWSFLYYDELMMNPYEQDAFNRGGDDLTPMLVDEKSGKSSAWDIQFAFAHFQNHAVSIVPCESYTHNIGMDGTGTHCGALDDSLLDYPALKQNPHPRLIDTLYFDSRIINMLHSIFARKKRPLWQKIINIIARKTGNKPPFTIKKKVYA